MRHHTDGRCALRQCPAFFIARAILPLQLVMREVGMRRFQWVRFSASALALIALAACSGGDAPAPEQLAQGGAMPSRM